MKRVHSLKRCDLVFDSASIIYKVYLNVLKKPCKNILYCWHNAQALWYIFVKMAIHGLISQLPPPYYEAVKKIWSDLDCRFGIKFVWHNPIPHFSWQIAENHDNNAIVPLLDSFSKEHKPFYIETQGLARFDGEETVLFIKIVPEKQVVEMHKKLWELLLAHSQTVSILYSPKTWIPHITLASQGLTEATMREIKQFLAPEPFLWRIRVDNILLASQRSEDSFDVSHCFQLGKGLIA